MGALTWKEARYHLRELLIQYIEGPSPELSASVATEAEASEEQKKSLLSSFVRWWLRNDMDLYAGSFALSLALLILESLSLISSSKEAEEGSAFLNAAGEHRIYRSQVSASVLLLASSLWGIWMVRRRRYACIKDIDSVKRREIQRFLKSMERKEEEEEKEDTIRRQSISEKDGNLQLDGSSVSSLPMPTIIEALKLPGTALTDIYPVYRSSGNGTDRERGKERGSWNRIPTLLLVKGDYIALQVGDIAPARCKNVGNHYVSSSNLAEIACGERITTDTFSENVDGSSPPLPKGRSTLPTDSEKLLKLCNNFHLFVLLESPLHWFLQQSQGMRECY
jgi:hypothetical protein